MDRRTITSTLLGKPVISKSGKRLGIISDLVFEIRTGELLHFVLDKPSLHIENMKLDKNKQGDLLIPFSAVSATEDFVVVDEGDIL